MSSSKESVCKIVFIDDQRKSIIWNPKGKIQAQNTALEHLRKFGVTEPSLEQYEYAGIEGVYFNGRHLFRFNRKGELKFPRKSSRNTKKRENRRFGGLGKIITVRHFRQHHPKQVLFRESRQQRRIG